MDHFGHITACATKAQHMLTAHGLHAGMRNEGAALARAHASMRTGGAKQEMGARALDGTHSDVHRRRSPRTGRKCTKRAAGTHVQGRRVSSTCARRVARTHARPRRGSSSWHTGRARALATEAPLKPGAHVNEAGRARVGPAARKVRYVSCAPECATKAQQGRCAPAGAKKAQNVRCAPAGATKAQHGQRVHRRRSKSTGRTAACATKAQRKHRAHVNWTGRTPARATKEQRKRQAPVHGGAARQHVRLRRNTGNGLHSCMRNTALCVRARTGSAPACARRRHNTTAGLTCTGWEARQRVPRRWPRLRSLHSSRAYVLAREQGKAGSRARKGPHNTFSFHRALDIGPRTSPVFYQPFRFLSFLTGGGESMRQRGWISVDRGSKTTLPLTMPRRVFKSSAKDPVHHSIGILMQGCNAQLLRCVCKANGMGPWGRGAPLLRVGCRRMGDGAA